MPGGIELAKAYVQIVPSTEGIQGDLNAAMTGAGEEAGRKGGKSIASGLGSALGGIGKTVAVGAAAAATAATAFGGAVVKGAADLAAYGDDIDKMSQKMGMSATAYQEWDAVMQHSGTTMASMQAGMKTLANAVENGNAAFERIGLTEEQIRNMSQEDLFGAVIEGLQGVEDTTERTYLAGQLLGRGATELGALLNTSAEETQAMKDRVHELGGVLGDDVVKESAAFQDNLQDMRTAMSGMKRSIVSQALPGLNQLITGFTSLVAGEEGAEESIGSAFGVLMEDMGGIVEKVGTVAAKLIPEFVNVIVEHLPEIIDTGMTILTTLFGAMIDNLPTVIETVVSALPTVIPQIIDGLVLLITTLMEHLPEILQVLIDALPDILISLIDALMENLPVLLEGIVQLVVAVVEKLPEILAAVWEVIVHVWTEWVQPMLESLGQFLADAWDSIVGVFEELGTWFDENVVQPIVGFFEGLWESVSGFFQSLWDDIVGIWESVSGWFDEHVIQPIVGFFTGLWDTVKEKWEGAKTFFTNLWDGIKQIFKTAINGIIDILNGMIRGLNILLTPLRAVIMAVGNLFGAGWTMDNVAIPEIPKLATGGVITGPRVVLAGEEGDEAIMPLENNTGWIRRLAYDITAEGGMTGGDELLDAVENIEKRLNNLQVVLDGDKVVGGISGRMDRALGNYEGLQRRGVATA